MIFVKPVSFRVLDDKLEASLSFSAQLFERSFPLR